MTNEAKGWQREAKLILTTQFITGNIDVFVRTRWHPTNIGAINLALEVVPLVFEAICIIIRT